MSSSATRLRLVYKFLPAEFALQDLIKQEIKVSTFFDMNDPFELLTGTFIQPHLAHLLTTLVNELNGYCGVLCRSQQWQNAMLWSHYGDKHNGMCIGIKLGPKVQVSKPRYVKSRRPFDADMRTLIDAAARLRSIRASGMLPPECERAVRRLLLTKFKAWAYEREVRVFIKLKQDQRRGCHYFAEFDEQIRPVSLILGQDAELQIGK